MNGVGSLAVDPKKSKIFRSGAYNYNMDLSNGLFVRWGETEDSKDDPIFSPVGPEILDLEISTSVLCKEDYVDKNVISDGGCKGCCDFCYKSNGVYPTHNMSFDEFKTIFHKIGRQLTQIAFGIMNIDSNPHFFKMAEYARKHDVIPNFTMHGLDNISDETIKEITRIFGAVAISYHNPEKTMDLVKRLTDAGMKQVNIHHVISEETYDKALDLIVNVKDDSRLSKLRAVVLLSLKIKGDAKRNGYHILSKNKYTALMDFISDIGTKTVGFDSCGAHRFSDYMHNKDMYYYDPMREPCESACFSAYINSLGVFYPCSFTEGEGIQSQSVLNCENFLNDIWYSDITKDFRNKLISNGRNCPVFKI